MDRVTKGHAVVKVAWSHWREGCATVSGWQSRGEATEWVWNWWILVTFSAESGPHYFNTIIAHENTKVELWKFEQNTIRNFMTTFPTPYESTPTTTQKQQKEKQSNIFSRFSVSRIPISPATHILDLVSGVSTKNHKRFNWNHFDLSILPE